MSLFYEHAGISLHLGDVRDCLLSLPAESVQCVVTSPPYFSLRDYGCKGQIGLEKTPAEYIATMVEVFREVRRVMRPDATLWLNMGDSYNGANLSIGYKRMNGQRYRLRQDLTPEQQAYVLAELSKARRIWDATKEGRE